MNGTFYAGLAGGLALLAACNSSTSADTTATGRAPAAAVAANSGGLALSARPVATEFGRTPDGQAVQRYTLTNAHGLQASIMTYGGTLTSLRTPDKNGRLGDVVLGFDHLADYTSAFYLEQSPYFGALIGRYANRIRAGRFTLAGKPYTLALNSKGNALHGGRRGFDKVVWAAQPGASAAGQHLTLTYHSKDGEEGYPGNLTVTVVYTLTPDDALRLAYTATTDQPTPLNLTNHTYFNLGPGVTPHVLDHQLTLHADRYTVLDADRLPTGELQSVQGTPLDFRQPHAIGERLAQMADAGPGGYDRNWVLADHLRPRPQPAATVYEPVSGRTMAVFTDQPGVQFYSGNFLSGKLVGKGHTVYGKHAGFCLETEHFPDSPNQPTFPNTILKPGQTFHSTTEFRFGVRK